MPRKPQPLIVDIHGPIQSGKSTLLAAAAIGFSQHRPVSTQRSPFRTAILFHDNNFMRNFAMRFLDANVALPDLHLVNTNARKYIDEMLDDYDAIFVSDAQMFDQNQIAQILRTVRAMERPFTAVFVWGH